MLLIFKMLFLFVDESSSVKVVRKTLCYKLDREALMGLEGCL